MTGAHVLLALTKLTGVALIVTWGSAARAASDDVASSQTHAAAPAMATVTVLARAVARGEVLRAEDLVLETRGMAQVRGALTATQAEGLEALRNLQAGSVVRPGDLVTPRLVRRGEPVTISVRYGGLAIASSGRALGDGGLGQMVRVVSISTNRTLDGVVEGESAVQIVAP